MGCCILDTRATAVFRKGFAKGVPEMLCLQGLEIARGPPHCRLPASLGVDESDFADMARATLTDAMPDGLKANGSAGEPVGLKAVRAEHQIARWTKARALGKAEDYGDYKWFRTLLQIEDALTGHWGW